ncbi:MAG: nucleotide sugar dehydrogenase [Spirosomataceae bacterium]
MNLNLDNIKIAVIGLGYVGLPLAVEFSKKYQTIGFDIDVNRVEELRNTIDRKNVLPDFSIDSNSKLSLSSYKQDLENCHIYIITVPTPINNYNKPDLSQLILASETVAKSLRKGNIVVYESTVYPGCTEDDCVSVLEKESGLKFNIDFFCGYSPERINPGDKSRKLTDIVKITSGSTPDVANFIDNLYKSIIPAGTYRTSSIKIAEAAKLIENCQRDINISFVNELVLIFDKMGISTKEVLEAAKTKWNFLDFRPGLVGGHCIGVDPYYLIHQSEKFGYTPQLTTAGRMVNNTMPIYVANCIIKKLVVQKTDINATKCLILGFSYKPNTSDFRNTKVVDIYHELKSFGLMVDIFDPLVNIDEVKKEYAVQLLENLCIDEYQIVLKLVDHTIFQDLKHHNIISLEDIFG